MSPVKNISTNSKGEVVITEYPGHGETPVSYTKEQVEKDLKKAFQKKEQEGSVTKPEGGQKIG